ncbi:hypothetical protein [Catalinimonas niigatensis]|uniref:hypothetical protein n=1 Tax=Catalinimonas niigatensis TaxID=1397264 RepID=UPI002666DE0F|nr:hypothetical protein [Catalinimonas niigatensis]WPP49634.1 hypothetical protein PZB72_23450 [Catalinimonas niigatensis]
MAKLLGELSLQARDTSDLFYQHQVFEANVTDQLEKKLLDSAEYITGFDASGTDSGLEEVELLEDRPDLAMLPIEVEEGNQQVKVIYCDAGNVDKAYEVIVYLLLEEQQ